VNQQLEKGYYFFSDIKKEGIVIYDSGQFHLAEAKERSPAERKAQAQAWFDQWFDSAFGFYEQHEHAIYKGRFSIAAFELHQATERLYHCVLLVLTAYKPKVTTSKTSASAPAICTRRCATSSRRARPRTSGSSSCSSAPTSTRATTPST
jgi:hypothetical protein